MIERQDIKTAIDILVSAMDDKPFGSEADHVISVLERCGNEIASLRQQLSEWKLTNEKWLEIALNRESVITNISGQLADAKVDADRYRWLLRNSFDREGFTQFHIWKHTWEPHSKTGEPTEWKHRVRGSVIDATVDEAMKESKDADA